MDIILQLMLQKVPPTETVEGTIKLLRKEQQQRFMDLVDLKKNKFKCTRNLATVDWMLNVGLRVSEVYDW